MQSEISNFRFSILKSAIASTILLLAATPALAAPTTLPTIPTTSPAGLPVSIERVPFCPRPLSMVKIPAGKIEMPTTRPGVKTEVVEIKSIWVSTTELTWDHYEPWYLAHDVTIEEERFKLWGKSRPSYIAYSDPYDFGREGHPAIFIHPYSAGMYCKWLSEKTGMKYRLPSEAEWEYACRAGRERDGASVAQLLSGAWAAENSDESTHFVAERSPNPWGLYDMLGNVAEWVIGYDGQPVLKGGSFMDKAADLNSRMRQPLDTKMQVRDPQLPKSRWYLSDADYAGFRIVRED